MTKLEFEPQQSDSMKCPYFGEARQLLALFLGGRTCGGDLDDNMTEGPHLITMVTGLVESWGKEVGC